jgi:hypothetical protein
MKKLWQQPTINLRETLRSLRERGVVEERAGFRTKPVHIGDNTEYPVLVWRVADPVGEGYDEIALFPDGVAVITTTWGSEDLWDRWVVFPSGEIEYCGTVDGPRYLPDWVKLAWLEG